MPAVAPIDNPFYDTLVARITAAGDEEAANQTVDTALLALLPSLWAMNADKGAVSVRLQYLYTMKEAILFWQSSVWRDVDYEEDVKESLRQKTLNLQAMLESTLVGIVQLERNAGSSAGGAVGQPDIVGILEPVSGYVDPSDPAYRGDARRPRLLGYSGAPWGYP